MRQFIIQQIALILVMALLATIAQEESKNGLKQGFRAIFLVRHGDGSVVMFHL